MVAVIPWRAVHYNPDKAKDLNKLIAPPYDQISGEMQEELYRQDPHNFVRLILGKILPGDSDRENRYTRSAAALDGWLKEKTLVMESAPCFFAYEQTFSLHGTSYTRLGLVGLAGLEPLGQGVLPHEHTFPKAKQDRLSLMKACKANFEHVFFLHDDPEKKMRGILEKAKQNKPWMSCQDGQKTGHTLWKIGGDDDLKNIQNFFKDKRLLIADGHHRYETSLTYEKEMNAAAGTSGSPPPYHFRLASFVSLDDPGLVILPTHRVLKDITQDQIQLLQEKLPLYFTIEEAAGLDDLLGKLKGKRHAYGWGAADKFGILTLKNSVIPEKEFPNAPAALVNLEVYLLHAIVFGRILNLPADGMDERVSYVRWAQDACNLVRTDSHKMTFFMNAVKPHEIREAAVAGEKMPHKSTDFYPKLWSGLVFYKMEF